MVNVLPLESKTPTAASGVPARIGRRAFTSELNQSGEEIWLKNMRRNNRMDTESEEPNGNGGEIEQRDISCLGSTPCKSKTTSWSGLHIRLLRRHRYVAVSVYHAWCPCILFCRSRFDIHGAIEVGASNSKPVQAAVQISFDTPSFSIIFFYLLQTCSRSYPTLSSAAFLYRIGSLISTTKYDLFMCSSFRWID
uniref:BAR domain-containing protein n=1 Tax=Parascaris univalens TaxID=6257 RepID=A0A914ZZQ5_PARUN